MPQEFRKAKGKLENMKRKDAGMLYISSKRNMVTKFKQNMK